MATDWISEFAAAAKPGYAVIDAMGRPLDNVVRAREYDYGVEVVFYAIDPEGNEFVGSSDDGVTLEPVEAHMTIPGGQIVTIEDE